MKIVRIGADVPWSLRKDFNKAVKKLKTTCKEVLINAMWKTIKETKGK